MKRVLILAYDFPPYVSVGSLRPYSWFKYFQEFGVYPVVVTRQWSNKYGNDLDYIASGDSSETIIEESVHGTVVKTAYKPNLSNRLLLKYGAARFRLLRKTISAYFNVVQYISHKGPKSGLYHGAREYLKQNKIDVIIATGEPYILFSYASDLSREFGIPWIADYRDPWSQNEERQKTIIHKICSLYFEKKYLKNVTAITTVSELLKFLIGTGIKNKPFHILPNGYDPEAVQKVSHIPQQNKKLQIAITGTIYKWHPIQSFLHVLDNIRKDSPDPKIEIFFYGTNISRQIESMIKEIFPGLKECVHIVSKLPNEELMQSISSHNLMLLFHDYSHMGTKIYDYLGIKRKILLCYSYDYEGESLKKKFFNISQSKGVSQHLQEDLMNETNSGIVVKNAAHLYTVFHELQKEFLENGFIACESVNTENYSRKIQVKKLAEIILQINDYKES